MSSYDKHKSQVEAARQSDGKFGSYESGESAATLPPEGSGQPVNAENAIDALSNRFQDDEIPVRRGFASDAEVTYIGIGKYDGLYPVTVDVHKDGRIEVFQHSARTEEGSKLVDSAHTDDVSLDDVSDMAEAAWRSHPHPETAGQYSDPEPPVTSVDGVEYEHEEVIEEQGVVDADGDEWAARIEAGDGGFNVYAENLESGKTGDVTHYEDYDSAQVALNDIRNEISPVKQMSSGAEFERDIDATFNEAAHIAETQQISGTSKLDPEHAHLLVPVHQVELTKPDGTTLSLKHQRMGHADPSAPPTTAEVITEAANDARITDSYESFEDYVADTGGDYDEYEELRDEARGLRQFLGNESYSNLIEE